MAIKFANDIVKEIRSKGEISIPEGGVTGEEFEAWLYGELPLINQQEGFQSECNTFIEDVKNYSNIYVDNYGEAA